MKGAGLADELSLPHLKIEMWGTPNPALFPPGSRAVAWAVLDLVQYGILGTNVLQPMFCKDGGD